MECLHSENYVIFSIFVSLNVKMKTDDPRIGEVIEALTGYQSALLRYIFLLLGDEEDAKDVLQETNLYIWQNIGHLDCPEHFKPWAKTLATFQIKRVIKDRAIENTHIIFDSGTADKIADTIAEETADGDFDQVPFDALKKCLDRLPAAKRHLIDRRYWKRESVKEIAASRRAAPSAIAMTLLRVRKELGDCVRGILCRFTDESAAFSGEADRALLIENALEGDRDCRRELGSLLREDASARHVWSDTGSIHIALIQNAELFHLIEERRKRAFWRPRLWLAASLSALLAGGVWLGVLRSGRGAHRAELGRGGWEQTADSSQPADHSIEFRAPNSRPSVPGSTPATDCEQPTANRQQPTADRPWLSALDFGLDMAAQTGGEKMNARTALATMAVATGLTAPVVLPAAGQGTHVLPAMYVSVPRHWQTAFTNEIPIRWAWGPTNAVTAFFACEGMNASWSNTFAKADGDVSCFLPVSADEDLYTVRLVYKDSGGADLFAVTGLVARVNGAARAEAALLPKLDVSSTALNLPKVQAWPRVLRPGEKNENTVIAYDTAWVTNCVLSSASFTIAKKDGSLTSTAALAETTGWLGWKVVDNGWGSGWFSLTLTANGQKLTASVYRPARGLVISIR